MIKRVFLLLLVVLVIFGGLFGLKYRQTREAAEARRPPPPPVVAVTRVQQERWQSYLSAVGSLVAVSGIEVSNEVAGMVTSIHFDSGQPVVQGQLLLDLDTNSDRAELDGLLASQQLAQLKFNRQAKLLGKKVTSRSDYDTARALLDQAKAAVVAKRALIEKKQVRAPFDGTLGIRRVDRGQYLPPGSAIVPLQALDPIHVDFTLPERHLAALREAQVVELQVEAYPDERFRAKITALNPGVDPGTRTVRVRATLGNPGHRLRPGMFARVRVLSGGPRPVLTLPDTAITYNPYGDSVFLVEKTEQGPTVKRIQVDTGPRRHGRVSIVHGLEAGDRVVSAGQVKLRNGMTVRLDDKPAPAEPVRDAAPSIERQARSEAPTAAEGRGSAAVRVGAGQDGERKQ